MLTTHPHADFLTCAVEYLRLGWEPIVLQPKSKTPIIKNWTTIPINEAAVRNWWTRWPSANVGIRTGAGSGVVVLDLDGDFSLDPQQHPVPITPTSKTGSGGCHYFFKAPSFPVKGHIRLLRGEKGGLDLRGDGNQVVAPPSLHPNGQAYEWIVSPFDTPLADLPAWVLIKGKGNQPSASEQGRVVIPQGGRNKHLASLAGTLRYRGGCEESIRAALLVQNLHCCCPPLGDDEVERIVKSVMRYESAER